MLRSMCFPLIFPKNFTLFVSPTDLPEVLEACGYCCSQSSIAAGSAHVLQARCIALLTAVAMPRPAATRAQQGCCRASSAGALCRLRKRCGSASIRLVSFPTPLALPLSLSCALAAAQAAESSTSAFVACPVRNATSSAKLRRQGSVGYICACHNRYHPGMQADCRDCDSSRMQCNSVTSAEASALEAYANRR